MYSSSYAIGDSYEGGNFPSTVSSVCISGLYLLHFNSDCNCGKHIMAVNEFDELCDIHRRWEGGGGGGRAIVGGT